MKTVKDVSKEQVASYSLEATHSRMNVRKEQPLQVQISKASGYREMSGHARVTSDVEVISEKS